jgi:hypothetical protein
LLRGVADWFQTGFVQILGINLYNLCAEMYKLWGINEVDLR